MTFPETVEEFMEQYKIVDREQVYTNGAELVPIFRIKQWFEHEKAQLSSEGTTSDLISRTEVVEHLRRMLEATVPNTDYDEGFVDGVEFGISTVSTMPPAQSQSTTGQLNDGAQSTARSTDLIDRRAAIDAINHICPVDTEYDCTLLDRVDVRCVLSDLPSVRPVATDTNVGDTISRQAAIDELPYLLDYDGLKGENGFVSKRLVRKMLKELPPEQPIIKCKDCKWWTKQKDSAQGRCELLGMYPACGWYCANAERRTECAN